MFQIAVGDIAEARRSLERADALSVRLGMPVPTVIWSRHLLCLMVDEGWEQIEGTFAFLAASDDPALAWARGFVYGVQAQIAARRGDARRLSMPSGAVCPGSNGPPPGPSFFR